MDIIIASNNQGKISEYSQLLATVGFSRVLSLEQAGINCVPEENGSSFEQNAVIKARALKELCGADHAVIADDSGLEIDALGGQPGIYSARFGGLKSDFDRNALVLQKLEGVPKNERGARFVCVICFILPDGEEITVRGECDGYIGFEPLGDNGFGYDPIFMYNQAPFCERSFAQINAADKNKISHRANALDALLCELKMRRS